jgi:methionyl-tRNA formyltransferase
MKLHGIHYKRLEEFAKKIDSDVLYCQNYNTHTVHEFISKKQPDIIVFTGGGLIRQPLLDISGKGVVNCHSGILPEYKGMDVVEWPILQGKKDMNGFTVHLMDPGIDTGPILKKKYLPLSDCETTTHYRERMLPMMAEILADTTVKYLDGKVIPKNQNITNSKQYYIMHDKLKKKLSHKYLTP